MVMATATTTVIYKDNSHYNDSSGDSGNKNYNDNSNNNINTNDNDCSDENENTKDNDSSNNNDTNENGTVMSTTITTMAIITKKCFFRNHVLEDKHSKQGKRKSEKRQRTSNVSYYAQYLFVSNWHCFWFEILKREENVVTIKI